MGINGVYSLDFDTAQENIQKVFETYPDHPFAHFGNAMIAWSRYEYEYELSDDKQRKEFEKILNNSIAGIKRWIKKNPDDPNEEPVLGYIEDDEEYELVADAFDEFLDSVEYDEIVEEE